MTERLTTLHAVKDWLLLANTPNVADDQLIRIIDAASQFALNYMNRDSLQVNTYSQSFRGNGKTCQLLRNWPVVSVTELGIGGNLISPAIIGQGGLPSNGYVIGGDSRSAPQSLDLYSSSFWLGAFCRIIYVAGFQTSINFIFAMNEQTTISPQDKGQWTADMGVKKNGVAMVLTSNSTPAAGEYYVDDWGAYTFNAAEENASLVIAYNYAPWDVAFGVTQIVGEWYKKKERIGLNSKSLGGQETVSFSTNDISDTVKALIQPYRNVVPV